MSIVARGPRNILVIERNSVPVKDVCDSVAEHKTLSWLRQRYNVHPDEVFECLDTYVDMSEKGNKNVLSLAVFRDDQQKIAGIETVSINDRVYFAMLSYGRMFFPTVDNFNELFARTLTVVIIECLMDIKDGVPADNDGRYFIHDVVINALQKATSLKFDQNNVDSVLEDLDYRSVLKEIDR
jgi:hypothetical protein